MAPTTQPHDAEIVVLAFPAQTTVIHRDEEGELWLLQKVINIFPAVTRNLHIVGDDVMCRFEETIRGKEGYGSL